MKPQKAIELLKVRSSITSDLNIKLAIEMGIQALHEKYYKDSAENSQKHHNSISSEEISAILSKYRIYSLNGTVNLMDSDLGRDILKDLLILQLGPVFPSRKKTLKEYFQMCEDLVGFAGPVENVKTEFLKKLNKTRHDTIKEIGAELTRISGVLFSEGKDHEAHWLRKQAVELMGKYLNCQDPEGLKNPPDKPWPYTWPKPTFKD